YLGNAGGRQQEREPHAGGSILSPRVESGQEAERKQQDEGPARRRRPGERATPPCRQQAQADDGGSNQMQFARQVHEWRFQRLSSLSKRSPCRRPPPAGSEGAQTQYRGYRLLGNVTRN